MLTFRNSSMLLVPVLLATLAVLPSSAAGATRTVCPSGCGYTTLAAAVAAAGSGDTVQLAAGTYEERVTITVPMTITGAQAGVDARGRTGAESIVRIGGSAPILDVQAAVTLDGLDVDGSLMTGPGGAIDSSDPITVRNTRIRGASGAGIVLAGSVGNEAMVVERSVFEGNATSIYSESNGSLSVTASTITQAAGATGIWLADDTGTTTISGNRVSGPTDADSTGIEMDGSSVSGVSITGNELLSLSPAIHLDENYSSGSRPSITLNRMPRRTPTSLVIASETTRSVNANNNWWGCNLPSVAGSATCPVFTQTASNGVDASPYLRLSVAFSPSTPRAHTTNIATVLLKSSSSTSTATLPDGLAVALAVDNGTLAAPSVTLASGTGAVAYTVSADGGPAVVTATLDGASVTDSATTVGAPFAATKPPTIAGSPRVGSLVTCASGTWNGTPDLETYEWFRGSDRVATTKQYTLNLTDFGTQVTCRATATSKHRAEGNSTSPAVKVGAQVRTLALALKSGKRTLACGRTPKKPCPLKLTQKLGFVGVLTPARTVKTSLKLEVQVKSRKGWKPRAKHGFVLGAKPFLLSGTQLKPGVLRVRATWAGVPGDSAVTSGWRYVTVK